MGDAKSSAEHETFPPLALTMGDPAGIGPEIALRAWDLRRKQPIPPFTIYADPDLMEATARRIGLTVRIDTDTSPAAASAAFADSLPVHPIAIAAKAQPGQPDPANAAAVIAAIDAAVEDVDAGRASAVVTNPIAKAVLYRSGFKHPGHTEYLAECATRHHPRLRPTPVMMLACDELRVVPVTIHIPLAEVPARLTADLIERTVLVTHRALISDFGLATPRIAVTGLNPHAGESGALGREDQDIIAPVIERLARQGLAVTGPHPADTLFHAKARESYDAAVAMYHDQALIPIKTLAFDRGVNVTLGLPFVRTSPDHGTAFDIAGKGLASPDSLIASLKLADAMARRRAARPSLAI